MYVAFDLSSSAYRLFLPLALPPYSITLAILGSLTYGTLVTVLKYLDATLEQRMTSAPSWSSVLQNGCSALFSFQWRANTPVIASYWNRTPEDCSVRGIAKRSGASGRFVPITRIAFLCRLGRERNGFGKVLEQL